MNQINVSACHSVRQKSHKRLTCSLFWLSCSLPFVCNYNTHHKYPWRRRDCFCILLYFVCTSSILVSFCLDCPALCLLSALTTYNTNIHVPGGIRTRNPSKLAAADLRFRLHGDRNRKGSKPDLLGARLAANHLIHGSAWCLLSTSATLLLYSPSSKANDKQRSNGILKSWRRNVQRNNSDKLIEISIK